MDYLIKSQKLNPTALRSDMKKKINRIDTVRISPQIAADVVSTRAGWQAEDMNGEVFFTNKSNSFESVCLPIPIG